MSNREQLWIAFDSEGEGIKKAKPVDRADVEYFEDQTQLDEAQKSEWFEELFEVQERLESGSLLALHEVIDVCDAAQIQLPTWAISELKQLVISAVSGLPIERAGVGRANSNLGNMREEMKLFIRKETVSKIRAYQALEPCLFAFLLLPMPLKKIYEGKPLPDLGHTTVDAIKYAATALRGSFAQASEETIRKANATPRKEGWTPWIFTRQPTLEAMGLVDTDDLVLPEGVTVNKITNPGAQILLNDLPKHISTKVIEADAQSSRYIEDAQQYEYFEEFIEEQRKIKRARMRSAENR